jgi:Ca2+:H+ antiporter
MGQLIYVSIVTLVLYAGFLYIQTYRHRDYFDDANAAQIDDADSLPDNRTVAISFVLLLLALTAVILLSKQFAQLAEVVTARVGAPESVVGILVALLILMPEGVAASRAARADRLQQSLNLALGSTLATIGLTIPAVAMISVMLDQTLVLGLDAKGMVLLLLTLLVSALTFGSGRTNILSGFVHLVLFATFVFLALVP